MKKYLIATMVSIGLTTAALADSVTLDAAHKEDQKVVGKDNNVIGLAYATKAPLGFGKDLTVEVRVEDEMIVDVTPKKHEGLVQAKASYEVGKYNVFLPVTPYVAAAVGLKSKSDSNFNYYVAEVGAKTTVQGVGVKLASRLRTPFNEGSVGTGNKYRTVENSVTASYGLTKSLSVAVKYAEEHGDSAYNTTGVSLTRSF